MSAVSFIEAQARVLDRSGVDVVERFIDVPVIDGQAHVLVAGEGPAIMLVNGIGSPAAMWAPLMAQLDGFTLYAVDLPGYGLTDTRLDIADDLRSTAVRFLGEVVDGLGLDQPTFVANSLGRYGPTGSRSIVRAVWLPWYMWDVRRSHLTHRRYCRCEFCRSGRSADSS